MYSSASNARLLTNLSKAAKLEWLPILCEKEMSVGELCSSIKMRHSAVSQHLATLRANGLVDTRRDAQTIYYSCGNPGPRAPIRREFWSSAPGPPWAVVMTGVSPSAN